MKNKMKKYKPILFSTPMVQAILEGRKTQTRRFIKYPLKSKDFEVSIGNDNTAPNPYWSPIQVGDILWVRETWVKLHEAYLRKLIPDPFSPHFFYCYKADGDPINFEHYGEYWKPSIHMPRAAARIFLEVVSVRAERLQDISEQDAFAEGVIKEHSPIPAGANWSDTLGKASLKAFQSIWKDIHGEKSWEENPFVWVYEFKRIEKPKEFNDNGK